MDLENETQSDEILVARAGRGDRAAASELVARHTSKIYGVCYKMLNDGALAEDATQDTFVRLWQNVHRWKPGAAKFESWLYRVAINNCLDRLRRRKREAPEEAAPERADNGLPADHSMIAEERRDAVSAALQTLPPRQRQAIVLCHYQELSNIEAASVMEISIEAIESLLSRARRGLRDRLMESREELLEGIRYEHQRA